MKSIRFFLFLIVRQITVVLKTTVILAALLFVSSQTHAQKSALLWSTYFGGDTATYSSGMATDAAGNVYITGQTYSTIHIAT